MSAPVTAPPLSANVHPSWPQHASKFGLRQGSSQPNSGLRNLGWTGHRSCCQQESSRLATTIERRSHPSSSDAHGRGFPGRAAPEPMICTRSPTRLVLASGPDPRRPGHHRAAAAQDGRLRDPHHHPAHRRGRRGSGTDIQVGQPVYRV